VEKVSEM